MEKNRCRRLTVGPWLLEDTVAVCFTNTPLCFSVNIEDKYSFCNYWFIIPQRSRIEGTMMDTTNFCFKIALICTQKIECAQLITLILFSKKIRISLASSDFPHIDITFEIKKIHLRTKFSIALDQIIIKSGNSVCNSQNYNLKKKMKISRKDHWKAILNLFHPVLHINYFVDTAVSSLPFSK